MEIQVTEKHIKKGIPTNCKKCAIALALQDALEGYNIFDVRGMEDASPSNASPPSKIEGGFGFTFGETPSGNFDFILFHSSDVYQWASYTMSHTDADNVNNFIKEFDSFGYDKEKQESIPRGAIVYVTPFTFELSGKISRKQMYGFEIDK